MKANLIPCWMALADAKGMSNRRKVDFLVEVVHGKLPIDQAFQAIQRGDQLGFEFTEKEWEGMASASAEISSYSFVAERLWAAGIQTIEIMDKSAYPQTLKGNLKREAPILIYAKGNLDLLKRPMVAIVGARTAGENALRFTDNISEKAVRGNKVVVSGFARGVDKRALDSTLYFGGSSVIVLPQGIETYHSKDYYAAMARGNLLVISTYHPLATWSVGMAMDRNKVIYGLANEIFAAESNATGGTWEGVLDGMKRGRRIFVRQPLNEEKNANQQLIDQGAQAVDFYGIPIRENSRTRLSNPLLYLSEEPEPLVLHESDDETWSKTKTQEATNALIDTILEKLEIAGAGGLSVQELLQVMDLQKEWKMKLSSILEKSACIRKEKVGRKVRYFHDPRANSQASLF